MATTPNSPPKRMTRARAKLVEDKITTAKWPKVEAVPTKASRSNMKRKSPVDDDYNDAFVRRSPPPPKQDVAPATSLQMRSTVSGTRGAGQTANSTKQKDSVRPRGRPRKNTVSVDLPVEEGSNNLQESSTVTRSTRTASASNGVVRKKVTFQDKTGDDKENIVVLAPTAKRPDSCSGKPRSSNTRVGMRAKPIRKPTVKNTPAVRGKRANDENDDTAAKKAKPQPLSPKKDTQVAKGSCKAEAEGDELAPCTIEANFQVQLPTEVFTSSLFNSPSKVNAVNLPQGNYDVSTHEFQHPPTSPKSSHKGHEAFIQGSPPRRPPPSPFKNSMNESPKRMMFVESCGDSSPKPKESLLMKSPKRFDLGVSQAHPVFTVPMPNIAASLSKSPARRPPSPSKLFTPVAAQTSSLITSNITRSALSKSPRRPVCSPTKTLMSSFKMIKAPEVTVELSQTTLKDQTEVAEDKPLFTPLPLSPKKGSVGMSDSDKMEKPISTADEFSFTSRTTLRRYTRDLEPVQDTLQAHTEGDTLAGERLQVDEDQWKAENEAMTLTCLPLTDRKEIINSESSNTAYPLKEESEDEPQSNRRVPCRTAKPVRTPVQSTPASEQLPKPRTLADHSMTALAERFSQWTGASPDKKIIAYRSTAGSVFSSKKFTVVNDSIALSESETETETVHSPETWSYFEEAMAIREDDDDITRNASLPTDVEDYFRQSQISDASQEYGDENVVPIDSTLIGSRMVQLATCTPARTLIQPREVLHTISKVPLKPPADYDDSPLGRSATASGPLTSALPDSQCSNKGYSFSDVLPMHDSPDIATISRPPELLEHQSQTPTRAVMPLSADSSSPKAEDWSVAGTPARTPRADLNCKLLSGAVVYVDVHTAEGADASGIFVDLLLQMGAKNVKRWNWNPRTSVSSDSSTSETSGEKVGDSKVGITHVVFKDGGKRTLEKVRAAKGLVLCVGVGWVLDCESENKWMDEGDYMIDVSAMPHAGYRRRKSMEPTPLPKSSMTAKMSSRLALSSTKELLNLSSASSNHETPSSYTRHKRRVTFGPLDPLPSCPSSPHGNALSRSGRYSDVKPELMLKSLEAAQATTNEGIVPMTFGTPQYAQAEPAFSPFGPDSPETPYFLHPDKLIQKTCPPKQTQKLLFPLSGRIEDQPDHGIKQRLLLARRKSLQWAPKVGSPLARDLF